MSDWYNSSGSPATNSSLRSNPVRAQFTAIETGLSNKLPALAGQGGKIVAVNSGGTALESVDTIAGLTFTSSVGISSGDLTLTDGDLTLTDGALSVGGDTTITKDGNLIVHLESTGTGGNNSATIWFYNEGSFEGGMQYRESTDAFELWGPVGSGARAVFQQDGSVDTVGAWTFTDTVSVEGHIHMPADASNTPRLVIGQAMSGSPADQYEVALAAEGNHATRIDAVNTNGSHSIQHYCYLDGVFHGGYIAKESTNVFEIWGPDAAAGITFNLDGSKIITGDVTLGTGDLVLTAGDLTLSSGRLDLTTTTSAGYALSIENGSATGYGALIKGGSGVNTLLSLQSYTGNSRFSVSGDGDVFVNSGDLTLASGDLALDAGSITVGAGAIYGGTNDVLWLYGGTAGNIGFNMGLISPDHGSFAKDLLCYTGPLAGDLVLHYDFSNQIWDFQDQDIATTGDMSVAGVTGFGTPSELTIATGAVAITKSFHVIDTESNAASDDLVTGTGGSNGDQLFIRSASGGRAVVVKHGTGADEFGNNTGADISLTSSGTILHYIHNGTRWIQPD